MQLARGRLFLFAHRLGEGGKFAQLFAGVA